MQYFLVNNIGVLCFFSAVRTRIQNTYYGVLEVQIFGLWTTICPVGWNDKAAHVACKELGFYDGVAIYASRSTYSTNSPPIILSHFNCTGTESSLSNCSYSAFDAITNCNLDQDHVAGVLCFKSFGNIFYLCSYFKFYHNV